MSNETTPLDAVSHGDGDRGPNGRFGKGNRAAKGNPTARKMARLRSALLRRVSPADLDAVVDQLVNLAKAGDLTAIKELLDRVIGRPVPSDVLERVEALERLISEQQKGAGR